MSEFKRNPDDAVPVIKKYKEEGRHGDTYSAQRLPVGQRRDFQPRVKRKEQRGD